MIKYMYIKMSISRVNDNNPLKFSMLDDESIDKLDSESLKRLVSFIIFTGFVIPVVKIFL